jgi:glutamine synthetase
VPDDKKLEYGVVRKLPLSIDASVSALEMDVSLMGVLPSGLAHDYIAMKREEQKMLAGMSETGRRIWMIERY